MKKIMMTEAEKESFTHKERTIHLYWEYHERWERKRGDSLYMIKEGIQTVLEVVFDVKMEDLKRPDIIKKQTYYDMEEIQ